MWRALLMGAALALALSACGQQNTGGEENAPGEGDGEDDRYERDDDDRTAEGDVQVLNFHGDENGFPDQRPEDYVATEFTTFSDMEWDEWHEDGARGEGEVLGTWCMDQGCQDDPYDVDVELADPVDVDGTPYFSTYTITDYGDMPEEQRQALDDADGGRLAVPSQTD